MKMKNGIWIIIGIIIVIGIMAQGVKPEKELTIEREKYPCENYRYITHLIV